MIITAVTAAASELAPIVPYLRGERRIPAQQDVQDDADGPNVAALVVPKRGAEPRGYKQSKRTHGSPRAACCR